MEKCFKVLLYYFCKVKKSLQITNIHLCVCVYNSCKKKFQKDLPRVVVSNAGDIISNFSVFLILYIFKYYDCSKN